MHELSLAGGILRIVEDAAARERFTRVRLLRLEAGALAGVEVQALRFALNAVAPGTVLAGAQIEIHQPPGRGRCAGCGAEVPVAARGDPCPRCGGFALRLTGGTELKVSELIVHSD